MGKVGKVSVDDIHCADATDPADMPLEVGLIEIAGDRYKGINIQPGWEGGDGAVYDAERDGAIVPAFQQTSAQLYWNWAMRPGWQKWRSKYRYGTITHIYTDTGKCDLVLDECLATDRPDGKSLNVNQVASLGDVPIEYMDCDSAVFSEDDEVIVELSHDANNNWVNPKVIGFKSEPKECHWEPFRTSICGKENPWQYRNLVGGVATVYSCPITPPIYSSVGAAYNELRWIVGDPIRESSVVIEAGADPSESSSPYISSLVDSLSPSEGLLKIKLTSSIGVVSSPDDNTYIRITGNDALFPDPTQTYIQFRFDSVLPDDPGNHTYNVSSGDGTEQIIDMTSYGAVISGDPGNPSQITGVTLGVYSRRNAGNEGVSIIDVEYIDFN